MNMFLNNKPATEYDLAEAFTKLGDLDTIELSDVDANGNLYFEVNVFKPFVSFSQ